MVNGFSMISRFFHRGIALMLVLLTFGAPAAAQDSLMLTKSDQIILTERIQTFTEEAAELLNYIEGAQTAQIESINRFADIIKNRWKGFMYQEEELISQDDSLMVLVTDYEQTMKLVTDSIASREKALQLHAEFVNSEKFIISQQKNYEKLQEKATLLSLTPKTQEELEAHKTREQLLFAEVQQSYDKAKEAAARDAKLNKRMQRLEEAYIQIKILSGKIQESVYKTPMERAKDYLLSLACLAILLMFVNMLISRIQAYKQVRKAAKDMKKMMEMQNNDIPTI